MRCTFTDLKMHRTVHLGFHLVVGSGICLVWVLLTAERDSFSRTAWTENLPMESDACGENVVQDELLRVTLHATGNGDLGSVILNTRELGTGNIGLAKLNRELVRVLIAAQGVGPRREELSEVIIEVDPALRFEAMARGINASTVALAKSGVIVRLVDHVTIASPEEAR